MTSIVLDCTGFDVTPDVFCMLWLQPVPENVEPPVVCSATVAAALASNDVRSSTLLTE